MNHRFAVDLDIYHLARSSNRCVTDGDTREADVSVALKNVALMASVHLDNPSELFAEEHSQRAPSTDTGGGRNVHPDAADTGECHFQQADHQPTVADVVTRTDNSICIVVFELSHSALIKSQLSGTFD